MAPIYPPNPHPHHRALPPRHSHYARRVQKKHTNHRPAKPTRRTAPQDRGNITSRRGSPHRHITIGGKKSCATPTPPILTRIQTPKIHGTSGGDIRNASATKRLWTPFLFELPPKRCVQLQLWRPSRAQDALLTRAGRPKCLEIQILHHLTPGQQDCIAPLGARRNFSG